MRLFRAAAIFMVFLASPANAQRAPAAPQEPPKSPNQIEQEKANENAYKKSLGNIPDQPPADPWGGARAVEPAKPAMKDPPAKRAKASSSAN